MGTTHRTKPAIARSLALASLVALATVTLAAPAIAGHGPEAPGGRYAGYSTGAALHVDAVSTAAARLLDIEVGVAQAAADSEGLKEILNVYERAVVPDGMGDKHSRGHSSLAEVGVALQPPKAANQLAPFVAQAAAPGGEPVDASLLNQTVSPLVHASLLRRVARANWNDNTCVIGEPISIGEQHLARVELLETANDESTPPAGGFDAPVIGIDANTAGPARAATHVVSKQQLFAGSGDAFGLQSVVTNTLAPVTLFEGTPNEVTIEIDGPAYLSATADGTSGGAKALYRAPLVSVIQGGEITRMIPGQTLDVRVPPGTGDTIARIKLGILESLTSAGLGDDTTKADGTKAAAQANVVEVTLLDAANPRFRGATIALGHMEAVSEVPKGGIECSIPVEKSPSSQQVSVGDLFTTTISVTNPWECTITDLAITDVITTKQGAQFEVVKISDGGRGPSGQGLSNGTVNWPNLGSLAPGATKSVELTLRAQGAAGIIEDIASATGVLEACEVGFDDGSANVSALAKAKADVSGSATLKVPTTRVLGSRQLPATGLGAVAPMLGGGMLIGLAAALGRRLRFPTR